VCLGLIVGAIIKYTSPTVLQKSADVIISQENNSFELYGPPDYLRLRAPVNDNMTHDSKYYQYAFVSQIDHSEMSELELEEKVWKVLLWKYVYLCKG